MRNESPIEPPAAEKIPHRLEMHGDVRVDDYYWLRERENSEVLAYLEAENAHTKRVMAHTREFRERLFEEIKGRIAQDDSTVPCLRRGYWYYTRFEEGKEYPLFCRKRGTLESPEEVMLDANELAVGHAFYSVGGLAVSQGNGLLAWAEDLRGRRVHTIRFRNLETGEILEDEVPDVTGNIAWANDDATLFYARQHPETLRSYRIYRHRLGTDVSDDVLVHEETDETFSCYVSRSRSDRYLLIRSRQMMSDEYRYLDADEPEGEFAVAVPRERGHEYRLDEADGRFWIRTNDRARNFRLVTAPVGPVTRGEWDEVVPHREDVLLEDFTLFERHVVLEEREEGLVQLRIRDREDGREHTVAFDEPAYLVATTGNHEYATSILRFVYTSLTTPASTYDYDMETRARELLKREPVLGDFDPADYVTERLWAEARDGTRVPISLVHRRGFERNGRGPLLLYGYGSYGRSLDAAFRSPRLSLLDRGFAFAIAHVRGGEELGREWYEDGKLLDKMNTFTDFIDCAKHLMAERWTSPESLYIEGGSAGGLLIGAVLNLEPELFAGAHLAVPFVDILTTMFDDSIPLTTSEYDEWGDPNEERFYDYMKSYSPYDNLRAAHYPPILVTTGLHDSQVQYWEPAKWVAKLRALKTDSNPLLLKTELAAGHGGPSGRYRRYEELAFVYAFFLDLAGRADVSRP